MKRLLFLLALAPPAGAYTTVTNEHVDLQIEYVGGALSGKIKADSNGNLARTAALLFDGPAGTTSVVRPADPVWDFLGVAAGQTLYYWPQSLMAGRTYLGFGADDGTIPTGTLASYYESDPRVESTAPWIKIALTAMRYEAAPGESGAANFSLWQTGGFGPPDVWMSTADGGITATDATWLLEGGHAHHNWGFTKRGYYQLDFKFSGKLSGSNVYIESQTQTYHFGVEFSPATLPVEITARGPGSMIANDPATGVLINRAGTSGSIALGAAVTGTQSVVQNTTTAATVDTALKTLRTGSITIASGKADLTIGEGTLASTGDLLLDVENATAALTIHAAIAASIISKSGPGILHLHGPLTNATLNADAGTTHIHASQTLAALNIGAGSEVTLTAALPSFAPVPEPGALALLVIGALTLRVKVSQPQPLATPKTK